MRRTILLLFFLLFPHDFAFAQATSSPAATSLRVSSNFPGGSARALLVDQANNLIRITPAGDPNRGWPCWWYLRVDGVDASKPLALEVIASEGMVRGNSPGQMQKLHPNWSFPARAAFSIDGRNWQQTEPGSRQGRQCNYRVNGASNTLWLAWGPPFTLAEANDLIQRAAKLNPFAKSFELARTLEGRPVPGLHILEPGVPVRDRYGLWIQARTHAWEVGSSWVCSGFTEWIVSNDPAAKSLREKADITIVPIMDVDNVERGNGGKKQKPHEHNEDWGAQPRFPEVRAAIERLSAFARAGRKDVFLDLHNPGSANNNVLIYIPPVPLLNAIRLQNQNTFTNLMRAHLNGPMPFDGRVGPCGETYDPLIDTTCDAWNAANGGDHVLSLTIEIPWNTSDSTIAGYRKIGEQLGRCIESYLKGGPMRAGSTK